jgi:hypothetical protein
MFVILAGRPLDPGWEKVMEGVEEAMVAARKEGFAKGVFNSRNVNHRRGLFAVLNDGVSFGGGQRVGCTPFLREDVLMLFCIGRGQEILSIRWGFVVFCESLEKTQLL